MLVYNKKKSKWEERNKMLFGKYQLIGKLNIAAKTCVKRNKEISTIKEWCGPQHWNKGKDVLKVRPHADKLPTSERDHKTFYAP